MYHCNSCGKYVDNDWHPCEVDPNDSTAFICPSCVEDIEEEAAPLEFSATQLADIKRMENEE